MSGFNPSKESTAALTPSYDASDYMDLLFQPLKGINGRSDRCLASRPTTIPLFQPLKGINGRSDRGPALQPKQSHGFQPLKGINGRSDERPGLASQTPSLVSTPQRNQRPL